MNKSIFYAGALSLALASSAFAHSGAKGIVKQRMDAMSAIGDHMKAVNAMIRGTTVLDLQKISDAMNEVTDHARSLPEMFPTGSGAAPSEAGPAIWSDPNGFQSLFQDLEATALAVARMANAGDTAALPAGFVALAKTCKACHETYRINRD